MEQRKVIITCAITGAIHTPTMSPHLPITPTEIAEAAIGAAERSQRGQHPIGCHFEHRARTIAFAAAAIRRRTVEIAIIARHQSGRIRGGGRERGQHAVWGHLE